MNAMAQTLQLLELENTTGLYEKSETIKQIEAYNQNPKEWQKVIKTGGDSEDSFEWNEAWYPIYCQEDMDET